MISAVTACECVTPFFEADNKNLIGQFVVEDFSLDLLVLKFMVCVCWLKMVLVLYVFRLSEGLILILF